MLNGSPARSIILTFVVLNAIIIVFRRSLTAEGFNVDTLILGHVLLFVLTLLSLFMLKSGMRAATTPAFLRSVYGSFMLKLFIAAIAVFVYAWLNKGQINKPSLFTLMGLYLVYVYLEVKTLLKLSRKGNSHG
jgi:hypothetical protein